MGGKVTKPGMDAKELEVIDTQYGDMDAGYNVHCVYLYGGPALALCTAMKTGQAPSRQHRATSCL